VTEEQVPENRISAQTNFTIVPNGVLAADITDRAFRTYCALRAYVRPGNPTFPKIVTVGERFGLSESYLRRGVEELREKGLIVVEKRSYANGFRKVNSYHFPDVADPAVKSAMPEKSGNAIPTSPGIANLTGPDASNLTAPIEEEKQEEEKQEEEGVAVVSPKAPQLQNLRNGWQPGSRAMATAKDTAKLLDIQLHIVKYEVWCAQQKKSPNDGQWLSWLVRDEQEAQDKARKEQQEQRRGDSWYAVAD
jgi:hypothetical protein